MTFSKMLHSAVIFAGLSVANFAMPAQAQMFQQQPEPADNRAVGLAQGKQLVGLAGKCLTFDNLQADTPAVIRDCDPNAISQRFKFEGGQLKSSAKVRVITSASWDQGARYAWENACLSAADQNRITLRKCGAVSNAGMQLWDLRGTEIRSGVNCFDVAQSNPANGNVVIYWGCQGQANQRWAMK
jgi:hypothetical protein